MARENNIKQGTIYSVIVHITLNIRYTFLSYNILMEVLNDGIENEINKSGKIMGET